MNYSVLLPYVLFTMIVIITPVLGGLERSCSSESRAHNDGLCGASLSDSLQLICMGNYNIPDFDKRDDEDHYPRLSPLEGIILGKREALSYLRKRDAGTRFTGIVCECCYNQCSFDELFQYCLYKRKRRNIPIE